MDDAAATEQGGPDALTEDAAKRAGFDLGEVRVYRGGKLSYTYRTDGEKPDTTSWKQKRKRDKRKAGRE